MPINIPALPQHVLLFTRLYDFLCLYHKHSRKFPKFDRYTIAKEIFSLLLSALVKVMESEYLVGVRKRVALETASPLIDSVKILLRLCRNIEVIDERAYLMMETEIHEIGKMLGGWIRSL